jgi:hypothetical protein
MSQNNKIIISKNLDFLLIICPFWIPLTYFLSIKNFMQYENIFFILVMILLGETHFGSTWWMYFEKKNIQWALKNKIYSIYYPVLILFFLLLVGLVVSLEASLFLILLFNVFHVTRQSSGIIKVYVNNDQERLKINTINNFLYFISFVIITYGLAKFVFRIDRLNQYSSIINTSIISYIVLSILYFCLILKFKNIKSIFSYFTGILIWMPLIWVDKIYHAFAMGVGMHYVQYLAITLSIYQRKKLINPDKKKSNKNKFYIIFFLYLFIYSIIMVALTNIDFFKNNFLFLIPIFFQTLHFYADMFTWRFSNEHIRENIGYFLYQNKSK